MKKSLYNIRYLVWLSLVSAMGGLLFGYDWVVIGGAKPFYELFFGIDTSPSLQGWVMSSALIGCIIGALIAGLVSDRYGRKIPLIASAILFIVSAYGTGVVNSTDWFVFYRIVGGIGIGLASVLSPLYIAEAAPAEVRGRLVSINQLTIVIGILLAQITNYLIAEPMPSDISNLQILQSWNGSTGWRWMFWAELVPAIAFFFLLFLVPESPRFLVKVGKLTAAKNILTKIGGEEYANSEMNSIGASFSTRDQKIQVSTLFEKKYRTLIVVGIVLAIFQQWCGINVIFNYADEIFTSAGYGVSDMLFNIVITGSVNLIFTFVAMATIDKLGRKTLMLIGSGGLMISYFFLGLSYYLGWSGLPLLIVIVVSIAIYAMSLAPVTWVVLSEIFPNKIRGLVMSMCTLILWIASFTLTISFPIMNKALNAYGTFWVYSLICALGFIFILKNLPETKSKSLEEIENEFVTKD